MSLNILHITPDFNYACGRSYYVYLLLKYLRKKNNVFLLTNGGDSLDRLKKLNIPYKAVKQLHSKNPISAAKAINAIRKVIKENNIDIVHTHHRYSELLALQAVKLIPSKRPRTFFTALSLVGRRYKIEYRSDKIIAVSKTVQNMLLNRFKIKKNKIVLIPNFVDTAEITARQSTKRKRTYNILAVGRFHPDKNFELLLKALSILNDNNIKLTLIGEGEKLGDYKKYIKEHNLNVEILGPQKKLQQYFLNADLCVLPSLVDPFPNFMLQSGLHRKPFIGSNVDGIAELIKEGVNGLLFTSGNAPELAKKIKYIKNNKTIVRKFSQNLHKEVINNYTEKTIIPQITKLYKQASKS